MKRIYFKLLQIHISEMFPINSARCIHAELRLMFGHGRRNIKRSAVFRLQLDHAGCFHYQLISISLVSLPISTLHILSKCREQLFIQCQFISWCTVSSFRQWLKHWNILYYVDRGRFIFTSQAFLNQLLSALRLLKKTCNFEHWSFTWYPLQDRIL